MKQKSLFLFAALVLIGAGCRSGQVVTLPPAENYYATSTPPPAVHVTSTTSTKPSVKKPIPAPTVSSTDPFVFSGTLPEAKNLAVPFLSQAPKMNWDYPYQEACEEASTIMVDAYYKGQTKAFTPEAGDQAILDLVAFEKELFGKYEDTDVVETAEFIKKHFKYKRVMLKEVAHIHELKPVIANGYPVIIPASGKTLANPNFRNGGPLYHMLVVKGYTKDAKWITNDPGTRKGADFVYTTENLQASLHDWNGGEVLKGKKTVIVILPNS
ncbi:hypothetical protein FJZ48_02870 [Candidatus Uhrbacteria bacterium]|nr:hypothetical protein [Candidatus Uhrbacteria bacterium]